MSSSLTRLLAVSVPMFGVAALSYQIIPASMFSGSDSVTNYDTAEVGIGSIHRVVATSGPVRPWVTVQIGSQLSGQIRRVLADFNSEVNDGDILAELDSKMFESKVEQAEADLAMAKAALTNQLAALAKAEAILQLAEQSHNRQHELSIRGVTSKANLDTANRDTLVANAEIAINRAQIENASANVLQRESMLKQAQIELERTRIRSPINGVVISRTVDIGQTVAASLQAPELFRIAQDLRSIHIEAHVNEADIGSIGQGNPATFTIDSYPGRVFDGKVAQVRLAPNEVQSVVTYAVLIEARNDDLKLFPGMTANVRIETSRRDKVLRIPTMALRFKPRDYRDRGPASAKEPKEQRQERMLERLKEALGLTDDQVASVVAALAKRANKRNAEPAATGAGDTPEKTVEAGPDDKTRGRSADRVEQALVPLLTKEQHRALEAWKAKRDATRSAKVWVLGPDGKAESRSIRLGLTDARFGEVASGSLKAGEHIIVGSRKVVSK